MFLIVLCTLLCVSLERNKVSAAADSLSGLLACLFLFMKFGLGLSVLPTPLLCKLSKVISRLEGRQPPIAPGAFFLGLNLQSLVACNRELILRSRDSSAHFVEGRYTITPSPLAYRVDKSRLIKSV